VSSTSTTSPGMALSTKTTRSSTFATPLPPSAISTIETPASNRCSAVNLFLLIKHTKVHVLWGYEKNIRHACAIHPIFLTPRHIQRPIKSVDREAASPGYLYARKKRVCGIWRSLGHLFRYV